MMKDKSQRMFEAAITGMQGYLGEANLCITECGTRSSKLDLINARTQTQKTTFEGYGVEQFDLLTNHSILEVRGNYILFVVHNSCDDALKAFLKAL